MADLKTGTTVGGAGLWHSSNLPLAPSGNLITYRGWRIYTEQDKPSAEDIGALSLANGGTVAAKVNFSTDINVTGQAMVSDLRSTSRIGISAPSSSNGELIFVREGITSGSSGTIAAINTRLGGTAANPYNGQLLTQMLMTSKATSAGSFLMDTWNNGRLGTRMTMDALSGTTTINTGNFAVSNAATIFGTLTGSTATFSGALNAASVTPISYTNFDARTMSGLPKQLSSSITTFADASVTEKNDIWSIDGTFSDGPTNSAATALIGLLVNYRRMTSTGAALVQTLHIDGTEYIRSGKGSSGAWTWFGTGTNGWRKVYDTMNKPAPGDFNAVSKSGDTMTGNLSMTGYTLDSGYVRVRNGFNGVPSSDPGNVADGTYLNSPEIRSGWNTRGSDTSVGGAYATFYSQELVGNYYAAIIQAVGYGKNSAFYFHHTGEFRAATVSGNAINNFRIRSSTTKSVFQRFDGSNWYFMISDSQDGDYNTLRPLYIEAASGRVQMKNGVAVEGGANFNTWMQVASGLNVGNLGGNSWGGASITIGDNDSGIRSGGDGIIQVWCNNARTAHFDTGQAYFDKQVVCANGPILAQNGNIQASGNVYSGNGSGILAGDGNVYGTRWGGWAYDWIIANAMSDAGRGGQQYSAGSGNGNGRAYEVPGGCFLTGINTNVADGRGMGVYFRQLIGRKINGGQFGLGDFA